MVGPFGIEASAVWAEPAKAHQRGRSSQFLHGNGQLSGDVPESRGCGIIEPDYPLS